MTNKLFSLPMVECSILFQVDCCDSDTLMSLLSHSNHCFSTIYNKFEFIHSFFDQPVIYTFYILAHKVLVL